MDTGNECKMEVIFDGVQREFDGQIEALESVVRGLEKRLAYVCRPLAPNTCPPFPPQAVGGSEGSDFLQMFQGRLRRITAVVRVLNDVVNRLEI